MKPKKFAISPVAADSDGLAQAQAVAGAGNLTLNGALISGGSYTGDYPRLVIIYSAGDDSGVVFTVTGTDEYGDDQTEAVTGANASSSQTTKYFATVTSIAADGACAGNVSAGTLQNLLYIVPVDYASRSGCTIGLKAPDLTYFTIQESIANNAWFDVKGAVQRSSDKVVYSSVGASRIRLKLDGYTVGNEVALYVSQPVSNKSGVDGRNDLIYQLDGSRDNVSGGFLTDASAGSIEYLDIFNGTVKTISAGEVAVLPDWGVMIGPGAFSQELSSPQSPATQTTDSLSTGKYTIWVKGSGSATISANTATITGAGAATDGAPLTFEVTVAGTVDVTVAGSLTFFCMTDTEYSIEPFCSTTKGNTATRAGTVSQENVSDDIRLLNAIDGAADGVNLTTLPYNLLGGASVDVDILTLDSTTNDAVIEFASNTGFDAGDRYETGFKVLEQTGDKRIYLSATGFFSPAAVFSPEVGHYKRRDTCTIEDGRLRIVKIATGSGITKIRLSSIYCKKISPAAFCLEMDLKLAFYPADHPGDPAVFIINSTTALRLSKATGNLYFEHNSLFSDTGFAPTPRIEYLVSVVVGDYLGTQSFQCQIQDTDGTWYAGPIRAAEDHFTPDDDKLVWGNADSWMAGDGFLEIKKFYEGLFIT